MMLLEILLGARRKKKELPELSVSVFTAQGELDGEGNGLKMGQMPKGGKNNPAPDAS